MVLALVLALVLPHKVVRNVSARMVFKPVLTQAVRHAQENTDVCSELPLSSTSVLSDLLHLT